MEKLEVYKTKNKLCPYFKSTFSIRKGSFCEKSRLTLQQWIHIMYCWSERTPITNASQQVCISDKMAIDSYKFF